MRTVVLRVAALALLLLLALVGVITTRTLSRLPDMIVYMARDHGTYFTLEGVPRSARQARELEERVRAQVAALVAGPTVEEAAEGLSSALPSGTSVLSASAEGDVVTVDLSAHFVSGGGTASMTGRLLQLYYTLTQPTGVDGVSLRVEGEDLSVLGGEGLMVERVWRRSEHQGLPRW